MELENEVTRFINNKNNVELVGTPFRDIGWFQAVVFEENK